MGLTLARKKDEEIVITVPGLAEPITILCISTNDRMTRLDITAQRDVIIHRKEVQDAIDKQNGKAKTQDGNEGNAGDTVSAEDGLETPQHEQPASQVEQVQEDRTGHGDVQP